MRKNTRFDIYFAVYDHKKSTRLLNQYYHELPGQIEEHEGKKYLMINYYMLDKVLDKIKEIIDNKDLMILKYLLNEMINCQMVLL